MSHPKGHRRDSREGDHSGSPPWGYRTQKSITESISFGMHDKKKVKKVKFDSAKK